MFSRALYAFDIGQNDLTAGYFLNMTTDEVRAFIPDVLGQFKTYVKVSSMCVFSCEKINILEFSFSCL